MSRSCSGRCCWDADFASTARTAWKNPTSSRIRIASSCGTARANALDRSERAFNKRFFPSVCFRMCSWAFGKRPSLAAGDPLTQLSRLSLQKNGITVLLSRGRIRFRVKLTGRSSELFGSNGRVDEDRIHKACGWKVKNPEVARDKNHGHSISSLCPRIQP